MEEKGRSPKRMGFLSAVMEMFLKLTVVVVAHTCEYTKSHGLVYFKIGELYFY